MSQIKRLNISFRVFSNLQDLNALEKIYTEKLFKEKARLL